MKRSTRTTSPDWKKYPRCLTCFRDWDCRRLIKGNRTVTHITAVFDQNGDIIRYYPMRVTTGIGGWGDYSLKRPHKGRRQRAKTDQQG